MDIRIERHDDAPADLAAELHAKLAEAGQTLSPEEMPVFLLSVRDGEGRLLAGCKGEIAFHSAHVSELWVDPATRGKGLGRALLLDAEAYARERGCARIHLETRNPKARVLYERLGYVVFGVLPDYEGERSFWYLTKPLETG